MSDPLDPAPPELTPEFTARYRLDHLLGAGAAGMVYRAFRLDTSQMVAIKFQKRREDPADTARFEAEARMLERIAHPNFVRIFETGQVSGHAYLVTEYVAGGTLRRRMKAGRLSIKDAARIVLEVLAGIEACHAAGIVHRDLKPDNILLTVDGVAKVADLGLARALGDDSNARTGGVLGTPRYMAPEQVRGETATPASDVFSVGLVLYEALAGVYPYEAPSSADLLRLRLQTDPPPLGNFVTGVPPAVTALVAKAMSREPALRPSAKAFAGALAAAAKKVANDSVAIAVPGARRAVAKPRKFGAPEAMLLAGALAAGFLAVLAGMWIANPDLFRSAPRVEPTTPGEIPPVAVHGVTTAGLDVELPGGQRRTLPPPERYPVRFDSGFALEAGPVAEALCAAVRLMDEPLAAAAARLPLQQLHARTGSSRTRFAPGSEVSPHLDASGLTPHAALLERHARAVLASRLSTAHRRRLETRVNQLLDLELWMRAYFLEPPFHTADMQPWPPEIDGLRGAAVPIDLGGGPVERRESGETLRWVAASHDLLSRPIKARRALSDPDPQRQPLAHLRLSAPRELGGHVLVPAIPEGATVHLTARLIPDRRHSLLVTFDGGAPVRLALAEGPADMDPLADGARTVRVAQRLPPGALRPGAVPVSITAVSCQPYDDAASAAAIGDPAIEIR